jgi:nucleolar protein 58
MKGEISKPLKKFLSKNIVSQDLQHTLLVADKFLSKSIKSKLNIETKSGSNIDELMRAIRININKLLPEVPQEEMKTMSLSLAHGLSRYKLKLSSEKVDTMVIQAVSLFQDLDKEINNY